MKKILNNNLKILVVVLASSIIYTSFGVLASRIFYANEVKFSSNNEKFTATNVEDALNELYSKSENTIDYSKLHILWSDNITSSSGSRQYMTDYNPETHTFDSITSYVYTSIGSTSSSAKEIDIGKIWYGNSSQGIFRIDLDRDCYVNGTLYKAGDQIQSYIYTAGIFVIIEV